MKKIFEHSSDTVYIKDTDLRYCYINQAGLNQLELDKSEIIDKLDTQMHFAAYAEAFNQHDRLAMLDKVYYQLDDISTKSGSSLYSLVQKFPLKDAKNKIHGCFALNQYLNFDEILDILSTTNRFNTGNLKVTVDMNQLTNEHFELTNREMDVLYYLLQGKSAKVIADLLKISERTVIFHINNLKNKWQCTSKEALLTKAFDKKLIKLSAIWNLLYQKK